MQVEFNDCQMEKKTYNYKNNFVIGNVNILVIILFLLRLLQQDLRCFIMILLN